MAICALLHYNASSRGTILCRRSRFTALQLNDYLRKRRDCDRPVRKQIVESNELFDRFSGSLCGRAAHAPPRDRGRAQDRQGGTTIPAEDAPPLPDLIGRRFAAGRPDVVVERASAGATTFTNTLLGVSAGGTTGYTRDPAGALVGIRGANRSYYLFDGLGSVVAVTSSSGSVTNSYTYDPFGVTTETKALLTDVFNPWRYAGQYQDTATGLYKMGARYYQPELGRWTQRDPSGADANAYAYVAGNPVNFVDPSGLVRRDFGRISYSIYASVSEAREIYRILSNPGGQLAYDLTVLGVCALLAPSVVGGIACGAAYTVGAAILQDIFREAAVQGACVKLTTGFGPNVGIDVVPLSNPYCDA
jgi:RHS repeat-associated protein